MSEDNLRSSQKSQLSFVPVIESVISGWLNTCQSGAIVVCPYSLNIIESLYSCCARLQSALLAGIATQLFVFMKNPENLPETESLARAALVMLSYMALVFNCSTSVTSLILIYRLGELRLRIANSENPLYHCTSTSKSRLDILNECGIGFLWTVAMYHCESHQSCLVRFSTYKCFLVSL